jgi:dipeptidase
MWRVYQLLAPQISLSPHYTNLKAARPYPVTAPTSGLNLAKVLSVHRDHYEGTAFDMTQHLAAGPFGDPNRVPGGAGEEVVTGAWERAISLMRISDSQAVQLRPKGGNGTRAVLWFGAHAPHATSYLALPAGLPRLPSALALGHQSDYNPAGVFWAVRNAANVMQLRFNMAKVDVAAVQGLLEQAGAALVASCDADWNPETAAAAAEALVGRAVGEYGKLLNHMLFKYADGYDNDPIVGADVGYPAWWLRAVGYPEGPGPVSCETC